MLPLLLIIFIIVPLIELYFLIQIGSVIGAGWTILLAVFTAILGAFLVRRQGFATLMQVQNALERGVTPAVELLEGVVLLLAGAMLLTPGFFTDAIGFIALVPPLRRMLINRFLRRSRVDVHGGRQENRHADQGPAPLEGDYKRVDDQ